MGAMATTVRHGNANQGQAIRRAEAPEPAARRESLAARNSLGHPSLMPTVYRSGDGAPAPEACEEVAARKV